MQIRLVTIIMVGFGSLLLGALGLVIVLNFFSGRQLLSDLGSNLVERDLIAVERSMTDYLNNSRVAVYRVGDALSELDVGRADALVQRTSAIGQGLFISDANLARVSIEYPDGLMITFTRTGATALTRGISRKSIGRHRQSPVVSEPGGSQPFSPVYYSSSSQKTVTRLELPLAFPGGASGRMAAEIAIEPMSFLAHAYPSSNQVVSFAITGDGRVIAHPLLVGGPVGLSRDAPLPLVDNLGDPVLAALPDAQPVSALDVSHIEGASLRRVSRRDNLYLVAVKQIANPFDRGQLTIGAYRRADEVRAPLQHFLRSVWIGLLVLVASLLAAVVFSRLVARPVNRASEAARNLRSLDFHDVRMMDDSRIAEIDHLSQSFNAMVRSLGAVAKYIPVKLVEKLIREQAVDVEPQERDLTVMFTDIAGFTSLCEGMSPAEVAHFINDHLSLLASCVDAEGGTIDKYIGDALMAFWGAPGELKDHTQAACRCALRIRDAIHQDNEQRISRGLAPVRIRIGIHSGPLVVGNIGSPSRVNYTVIGDNVNIAARLEQMGKDVDREMEVAILISETVRDRLGQDWQAASLGNQEIRGRRSALGVYRLLGQKP